MVRLAIDLQPVRRAVEAGSDGRAGVEQPGKQQGDAMSEEEKSKAEMRLKKFTRSYFDALEVHLLTGHTFTELCEAKVIEPVPGYHETFKLASVRA